MRTILYSLQLCTHYNFPYPTRRLPLVACHYPLFVVPYPTDPYPTDPFTRRSCDFTLPAEFRATVGYSEFVLCGMLYYMV